MRLGLLTCTLVNILLQGCIQTRHVATEFDKPESNPKQSTNANMLTVCAIDLSEDMSPLSTHNDEIAVFLKDTTASILRHTFTQKGKCQTYTLDSNLQDIVEYALIELDSDKSNAALSQIISHNFDSLMVYFKRTDYTKIRSILGDDDLLDIRRLTRSDSLKIVTSKGIHKMDKYHYSLTFDINE